ncbi:hypothetical protein [Pseudoxanthomonas composti]|uniref:Uncharacterized protein n=1 Tax=Pseudoxanthomonas composti TaxID=2137479 RepID=A0A4Q1JT24_9GAMM|nr:hypothetical protein [Pseudoxanthomonas composti]RXR03466.1 hypothetical protein EPA99_13605 [Pseudoxanthomonas composti]
MRALLLVACVLAVSQPDIGKCQARATDVSQRAAAQRIHQQQQRLKALELRGRARHYASLRRARPGPRPFDLAVPQQGPPRITTDSDSSPQAITAETAINLAALGFDASDVAHAEKAGIDLVKAARHVFSGSPTAQELVLLADTVVVARAVPASPQSPRQDGFLSELRFEVLERIKGTSSSGSQISVPLRSGTNPDGTRLRVTSEPTVVQGATYLLILSKNWYQQLTVESGKRPSTPPSASVLSVYQLGDDGSLLHRSGGSTSGIALRSVTEVAHIHERLRGALNAWD